MISTLLNSLRWDKKGNPWFQMCVIFNISVDKYAKHHMNSLFKNYLLIISNIKCRFDTEEYILCVKLALKYFKRC